MQAVGVAVDAAGQPDVTQRFGEQQSQGGIGAAASRLLLAKATLSLCLSGVATNPPFVDSEVLPLRRIVLHVTVEATELERRMRPGAWSRCGFLGKTESLCEVIATDDVTMTSRSPISV